jgi:hypothetical protein
LTKDVKLLAIQRYLEASKNEQEAYINLVSYTSFFSDKYSKTESMHGKVTGDAKVLLLNLIKSN